MAATLRQDGMARARSIIARAEREAQAVLKSAKEAAAAAEQQARERAEAILAGKPLPPESAAEPRVDGSEPISQLPAEGSTLRYRIRIPLSFGALLKLKREVGQLPGVTAVNLAPTENGESVLSLQAIDAEDAWHRLQSIPSLIEAER